MLSTPVSALSYDLIAPSGVLTRGQEVQFIINIDSQGATLTTAEVGLSYENQYLEYISTTPGDALDSITATETTANTLLLSGANGTGFSGAGVFAYVTFKIIATAPGTSELCALFVPETTPTPGPTSAPIPTELPKTGTIENMRFGMIAGSALLLTSIIGFVLLKNSRSAFKNKKH